MPGWIETQLRRLDSRGWFSGGKRRAALEHLAVEAANGNLEALVGLAERDQEPAVRAVLDGLDPHRIALAWYQTRHPRLQRGGVAREPVPAHVITALKVNRWVPRPEHAGALLQALVDRDPEVAARAREALTGALSPELQEELCRQVLAGCPVEARELWVQTGKEPASLAARSVYWLLLGQGERAEALEPDGPALRAGLHQLGLASPAPLLAALRERGLGHLVSGLLEREDPELVTELLSNGLFEELWRMALAGPVHLSRRILLGLREHGYAGDAAFEEAVRLADVPSPPPRPHRRLEGYRWLDWGDRRLYLQSPDRDLHCHDLVSGETLWSRAEPEFVPRDYDPPEGTCSPDGRWLGLAWHGEWMLDHLQSAYAMLNGEGELSWSHQTQYNSTAYLFSPCSRYVAHANCGYGENSRDWYEFFALDPLQKLGPDLEQSLDFEWIGPGQALYQTPEGFQSIRLEPFQRTPVEAPRRRRELWVDGDFFVQEEDGSQHRLPSRRLSWTLSDGTLVLLTEDGHCLWDGRVLRSLPVRGEVGEVLPRTRRLVVRQDERCSLHRLNEPEPLAVLPGRWLAAHPTLPYLATQQQDSLLIWHLPDDLPLGTATLEQVETSLLSPDRELARHLVALRLRHAIGLSDDTGHGRDFAIEL